MSFLIATLFAYCWVTSWCHALLSFALTRWMGLAVESVSLGYFPITHFSFAGTTISVGLLPITSGLSFRQDDQLQSSSEENSETMFAEGQPRVDGKSLESLALPNQLLLLTLGLFMNCAIATCSLGWEEAWLAARKVALPFFWDWTDPLGAGAADIVRLARLGGESIWKVVGVFAV